MRVESPKKSSGFTVVEIMVGVLLASLLITVAYSFLGHLIRGEELGTRESTSVIERSAMLERLLQDLRSSSAVETQADGTVVIQRNVPGGTGMTQEKVEWMQKDATTVLRREAGRTLEYCPLTFEEAREARYEFKVRKLDEGVLFADDARPAGGDR